MNKQQLANKIWESANKMRSKIEANEYKDYILGFIFYKYLSEREIRFLKENEFEQEDIENLTEEDSETMEYIQQNLGYFIAYENLFSTWLEKGNQFDVSNVRDALRAFSRLISNTHKKVFEGIFTTLETGLSKLGSNAGQQTKAISDLLVLIKDIPMDGKQDYDVLGFIYEYLIGMFAANAGKKAGEFYTPHEVSLLMSEIVAEHLSDRKEIKIYDPTSGSGSLLINIGKCVSKHMNTHGNIKYYAQELKQNTYNLTRMNLIMRGINVDNIVVRNADTLEEDWPIDEKLNNEPLYVDAVVSNPPYSQKWNPDGRGNDPRYSRYGLAPKGKADYAFLLHDLYHIKPDGLMAIVLPHGVLFRGGEEGEIRKNLIENNNIDAIIGLPANIFFGTGIPTIIMILKQKRENTDVLIIDASKGFEKEGKNNKLRASDIRKIVDTIKNRETIEKYSKKVSREEIRKNEYNLNIPRYVDSSEKAESWDIYASMFGGIPKSEIDELEKYWKAFPELKENLFTKTDTSYVELVNEDIKKYIKENEDIKNFKENFKIAFESFDEYLKTELIEKMDDINISKEEEIISEDIFNRLEKFEIIDKYNAYQILDNEWTKIATDLEIIQTEGKESIKKVDPNMVVKNKDGKETEVQEGWLGRVIPFEIVQETILFDDYTKLKTKKDRLNEIDSEKQEIFDSLDEEEKESDILNDAGDAFASKNVKDKYKEICLDIDTDEVKELKGYLELLERKAKKDEKVNYIKCSNNVEWSKMQQNKDTTYPKKEIQNYLSDIQNNFEFEEETFEYKVKRVCSLIEEEAELKKNIKTEEADLISLTKETIENLSESQIKYLLEVKWIKNLVNELFKLTDSIVNELVSKVESISDKYKQTYFGIESEIKETESILCEMIDELEGNEFDMKGLSELKSLLMGE